jgi:molybdopterin converting factor small subunit
MVRILIPTALRQFTEGSDGVEVTGATVGDALQALTTRYPNIKKNLYNDAGKLRSFVNVYVNDEDIRYLDKEETELQGNETITIVPSIAGGSTLVADAQPALSNDEIAR